MPESNSVVQLYTLGYQLRHVDEFIAELRGAGINILIDVREVAWSHRREYTKNRLQETLSQVEISYFHAKFVGNPKKLRRSATSYEECLARYADHLRNNPEVIRRFDSLVRRLLVDGYRICLTCYERHPDDCHRSVLLEHWQKFREDQAEVEFRHLATEGAPRFVADRKG